MRKETLQKFIDWCRRWLFVVLLLLTGAVYLTASGNWHVYGEALGLSREEENPGESFVGKSIFDPKIESASKGDKRAPEASKEEKPLKGVKVSGRKHRKPLADEPGSGSKRAGLTGAATAMPVRNARSAERAQEIAKDGKPLRESEGTAKKQSPPPEDAARAASKAEKDTEKQLQEGISEL